MYPFSLKNLKIQQANAKLEDKHQKLKEDSEHQNLILNLKINKVQLMKKEGLKEDQYRDIWK